MCIHLHVVPSSYCRPIPVAKRYSTSPGQWRLVDASWRWRWKVARRSSIFEAQSTRIERARIYYVELFEVAGLGGG